MSAVSITTLDLAMAALLLLLNGALSIAFQLKLERKLSIAAVRMLVQLALAGLVLSFVFRQSSVGLTLVVALVMGAVAGYELWSRPARRIDGWWSIGLGTGSLFLIALLSTLFTVGVLIRPDPWYAPRYLLPILGMVLGNALTSMSLTFDVLTTAAERERSAIEARIADGGTRLEAFEKVLADALRAGTLPILNSMAVAGVVALPGMMTGQILAGADPFEAAKYQMLILLVLAGAATLAVLAAGLGGVLLLTDARHRLRLDRLVAY
ncbi:MAG: ABC transporter permease [Hyphomicrobiaceae bacterium]